MLYTGWENPSIIARFVCREDKEVVFRKRNLVKESIHFPDAYITLDYPSEIQDERAVLIKAMLKVQAKHWKNY